MDLQIDRRPMSRGVTQLMYVGDDEAVEKATSVNVDLIPAIAAGLAFAQAGKSKGFVQLVLAGIGIYAASKVVKTSP